MPDAQIERILERVRRREQAVEPLFARYDSDQLLYDLAPYVPPKGDGIKKEDAYTSNRPKLLADKLTGSIASAERIIRVENDASNEEQRAQNDNYERLAIGMMRLIDQRLFEAGKHPLLYQLGFYGTVRAGYIAARALLRKRSSTTSRWQQGDTYVDVRPVDPRNLLFESGPDGTIWAALVDLRSRAQIRDEYPDFKFEDDDDPQNDADRHERVVDYYSTETTGKRTKRTRYMNAVIIQTQWAKKPADTFSAVFPVVIRAIGPGVGGEAITLSGVDEGSNIVPGIERFGESVFAPIRSVIKFKNRAASYYMAMTSKAVRQIYKIFSADGVKELDSDIDEDSTDINLNVSNAENIEPLEQLPLGSDAQTLLSIFSVEESDGTLPEQSWGRLPAPISGNALRILNSAQGERLDAYIHPIESCVEGILSALVAQYETGRYRPLKVSGRTLRESFSRPISPEDIEGHGEITVRLEPLAIEDDREKWLAVQLARSPGADGTPIVSDRFAREKLLKVQDSDLEDDRIYAALARKSLPITLLMTQWVAALKDGDLPTAQFFEQQVQREELKMQMEDVARVMAFMQAFGQNPMQAAAGGIGGGPQNPGGRNPNGSQPNPLGVSPEIAGLAGSLVAPPQPSPDAGANTTGPRNVEERANAIGLTFARR